MRHGRRSGKACRVEAEGATRQPSEPGVAPFVASLGEKLHPEADADDRRASLQHGGRKGAGQASLRERAHPGAERADAGQNQRRGAFDVFRRRRPEAWHAEPLQHVQHRPDVAHAVIDDYEHATP